MSKPFSDAISRLCWAVRFSFQALPLRVEPPVTRGNLLNGPGVWGATDTRKEGRSWGGIGYGIGWRSVTFAPWIAVRTSSGVSATVKMAISSDVILPRSTAVP